MSEPKDTKTLVKQSIEDMDRVVQLMGQAVEDNHNSLTQAGTRIHVNGHDFHTHTMCGHPDCALYRQLRFTWTEERRKTLVAAIS